MNLWSMPLEERSWSVTKYSDDNVILAWIVPMNSPSGDDDADWKMILWMCDNDAIDDDKVLQFMR